MPANQRFQLILSGRKPSGDVPEFARKMFEDMKGCEILTAAETMVGLSLTLAIKGDCEPIPPKYVGMFAGIVTERRGYNVLNVRPLFAGNLSAHVETILPRKN